MFESVGWGEILVLIVAGLFILGPERLPEAAVWLARTIRQVKDYVTGAREQLRGEFGPEFDELRKPLEDLRKPLDELRSLRDLNPRSAVRRALFDDNEPVPDANPGGLPNGTVPPRTNLTKSAPATSGDPAPPYRRAPEPLQPGERPPIDPDAT